MQYAIGLFKVQRISLNTKIALHKRYAGDMICEGQKDM